MFGHPRHIVRPRSASRLACVNPAAEAFLPVAPVVLTRPGDSRLSATHGSGGRSRRSRTVLAVTPSGWKPAHWTRGICRSFNSIEPLILDQGRSGPPRQHGPWYSHCLNPFRASALRHHQRECSYGQRVDRRHSIFEGSPKYAIDHTGHQAPSRANARSMFDLNYRRRNARQLISLSRTIRT